MAVTNEKSDIFTNLSGTPPKLSPRPGMVVFQPWIHTQGAAAGDANSTIEVWRIPSGARLYLHLSTIRNSAYGAARVLKFGWRAYANPDGSAVAADDDGLFAALDVAAAGFRHMVEAPTLGAGLDSLDSRIFENSADLFLTVTGGTIPIGAVTRGVLAYAPAG